MIKLGMNYALITILWSELLNVGSLLFLRSK